MEKVWVDELNKSIDQSNVMDRQAFWKSLYSILSKEIKMNYINHLREKKAYQCSVLVRLGWRIIHTDSTCDHSNSSNPDIYPEKVILKKGLGIGSGV